MILIADSGSTKTDWSVVVHGRRVNSVLTKGINPFFQTEEDIFEELKTTLLPNIKDLPIQSVIFYGAGCIPEKQPIVKKAVSRVLSIDNIEVKSDLLAAVHSVCGKEAGIVCILGTGSNSCFYDGAEIVTNVSPLGFILGDEGSGAVLGKLLIGDVLKNQLPEPLREAFFHKYNMTMPEIIDRVYRQPFPNRFLAGFSPFLAEHIDSPEIQAIVEGSFRAFFKRNVMQYEYQAYPVHLVGSVAFHYQDILKKVAGECGIRLGKIIQQPMEGLINYYSEN
ncbi:ATPase [Massilibacteroides sp.]|uniref:ATPase n=1 Tax=Massilibacteroides sp. TaxID=2034766 RepID=UPI002614BB8D|nr:ATPase [Massilibacteroides sp.]MDD4514159.1 ATPase [Massilibacteroides sp.]